MGESVKPMGNPSLVRRLTAGLQPLHILQVHNTSQLCRDSSQQGLCRGCFMGADSQQALMGIHENALQSMATCRILMAICQHSGCK